METFGQELCIHRKRQLTPGFIKSNKDSPNDGSRSKPLPKKANGILSLTRTGNVSAPLEAATSSAQTESDQENERRSQNAVEIESQQQVWKWLIIAVALALIFESLIARALQNREERATA